MSETIGFGILGLGIGARRAGLAPKTEGTRLVCVWDLQEEKAKKVAEERDAFLLMGCLCCLWVSV